MEEVDSIILHFLKQLEIEIPDSVQGLCDLPVEIIMKSATKCLKTINPSLKVATVLPTGVSHRIEVAAHLATLCKEMGFKNDVGYQTFLYHNETDLRQVFMFLIEHLPNESKQESSPNTTESPKSLLLQNISKKIEDELNSIWIPQCCYTNNKKNIGDFVSSGSSNNSKKLCMSEEEILRKLLRINELITAPEHTKHIKEIKEDEAPKLEIKESLKELKENVIILRQKLNMLESERNVMEVEYSQAHKSYENAEMELKNVLNILKSIGLEHLDLQSVDSMNNILEKVQQNIEMLHGKSERLTSENLALKLEIGKYKNSHFLEESEKSRCRKTLTTLKETAKSLKEECEHKEKLRDQLKKKYEKLKGGNKRSIYTKRILEIISNVDKQNLEISKVLDDTRQLQKEINSLEGQLDRCFSIADETLFGDAKKDDQAKKAYKLLALLHSECNTIVSLINETGSIAREIVDLEDNIKAEKTKRTEDTLKKIQIDLTKMQEEIAVRK